MYFLDFQGHYPSEEGFYISEIKPHEAAEDDLVEKPLEVGQQIRAINGKNLVGKTYLEIFEIIRATRNSYILDLLVADIWEESKDTIKKTLMPARYNQFCCTLL